MASGPEVRDELITTISNNKYQFVLIVFDIINCWGYKKFITILIGNAENPETKQAIMAVTAETIAFFAAHF